MASKKQQPRRSRGFRRYCRRALAYVRHGKFAERFEGKNRADISQELNALGIKVGPSQ